MILNGSALTVQDSKEKSTGTENSIEKKPVLLVRMSAIGDTILSARTHLLARERGYVPYLLTQSAHASLVQCMPQLEGACLVSAAGLIFLLRQGSQLQLEEVDEASFISSMRRRASTLSLGVSKSESSIDIVDLQSTSRSKRAIKEFAKILVRHELSWRKLEVRKLSFWRIVFVICSFFARKQKAGCTPPHWLSRRLMPVHQLQKEILEQLPKINTEGRTDSISKPVLTAAPPAMDNFKFLSSSAGHIVLQLGSSFRLKSWPAEYFRQLIELILNRTDLTIVLCGGPDDRATADYLVFSQPNKILNLVGRTPLAETLSWIRSARYVVTGDSFASHAADLMGIPASVLFGATHPLLGFAPEGPLASVHHSGLSCSPCSRHGQGDCRFKNLRCLTSIKPEEVFTKIEHILGQKGQSADTGAPLP